MDKKPPSLFRGLKRYLKKAITPAISPNRSPAAGPSRGLPPEPLDPDANPSQLNLSPPPDPQADPGSAHTSVPKRSETKDALIGGLKTFLELGAFASQGLPTQIPKAVFDSISYMIKIAEVSRADPLPEMTGSNLPTQSLRPGMLECSRR